MSWLENATLGIRPNLDYPNRICSLHDLYQIQNIVILIACKRSHCVLTAISQVEEMEKQMLKAVTMVEQIYDTSP